MSGLLSLAQGNNVYDSLPDPDLCRVNAENLLLPNRNVFGSLAESETLFKRSVRADWHGLSQAEAEELTGVITSGPFSIILGAAQGGCSPCGDYMCESFVSEVKRVRDDGAEYDVSVSAKEV